MKAADQTTPTQRVQQVLSVTVTAWDVRPAPPRAVARRAPHGDEPLRARSRRFFDAARAMATTITVANIA